MFENRSDAGRQLAQRLQPIAEEQPVILGLPRGGVPVAFEVAVALHVPLDVLVVRKVGAPHNPEFGVGAVGEGGVLLLDDSSLSALGLSREDMEPTIEREREELERRLERYRSGRPGVPIEGRTAVVVDDGIATGVSATAAARVLRAREVARAVLAVPVGAPESVRSLQDVYDEVITLRTPRGFMAVGAWYHDFGQTTDDTVVDLLARAYQQQGEDDSDDT